MTAWALPVGAALTVGGIGMNALGQRRGLRAQQRVYDRQQAHARGAQDQVNAHTAELLRMLTPETVAPVADAGMARDLDTQSAHLVAALQAVQARRGGNPEARAVATQANAAALGRSRRDDQVLALLHALAGSQNRVAELGRNYSADVGRIRGDAEDFAGLLPWQLQAAGHRGAGLRQAGNITSAIGQGMMGWGLQQPMGGAAKPKPKPKPSPMI